MLQIEGIKLNLEEDEGVLVRRAAAAVRAAPEDVGELRILRKALDAREGARWVYTVRISVKNEEKVLRRQRGRGVSRVTESPYRLPRPISAPGLSPVVAGAGPGGLFCALALARCGARPGDRKSVV